MKERVEVGDLTIGMFVAELDRPWLDTPFLLQGVLIESQRDIDELRQYCKFVYVEPERSTGGAYRPPPKESLQPERAHPEARAEAPAAAGGVDVTRSSFGATLLRILRAAFGRDASAVKPAPKAAPAAPAHGSPPGVDEVMQPTLARTGTMSAGELQYLVAESRQKPAEATQVRASESESNVMRLLDAIRSWFGSGARVHARRQEEQTVDADAPPPVYPDLATFEDELPKAEDVHRQTKIVVDQVIADIRANKPVEVRKVQDAVLSMVESVVRNANSFMWLARLKERDAAAYDHGLNVAVFLLSFGRHLGLPKGLLEILGTAGLMQDVGKLRLSSALLEKRTPLTAAERETLNTHVMHSIEILETSHNVSPVLIEIIAQHHERFDGTGYPAGLKGDEISMLGAMSGIVDTYAAMTNTRPYREAALPQEVLRQLYAWRGTLFHSDLVEKFIQCIGIFPVGSLVELNSREVAIVMAHSQMRRLKPRLMLILDQNRQPYSSPIVLDLLNDPPAPSGEPYRIVRAMQAGAESIEVYERTAAAEALKLRSGA